MPFIFDESDDFFIRPSTLVIGDMGESLVVKDLIRRRFYVYIPVIHSRACDMIIMKGAQTLRVEVKTSQEGKNSPNKREYGRYDVLAQVTLKSGRIRYTPQPESLILNFDPQIERCEWCGNEQPKTTDLSGVPCPCPKSLEAMRAWRDKTY